MDKNSRAKAFKLDEKTFSEYEKIYNKYKIETGKTNKEMFKEMLDAWNKPEKEEFEKNINENDCTVSIPFNQIYENFNMIFANTAVKKNVRFINLDQDSYNSLIKDPKDYKILVCFNKEIIDTNIFFKIPEKDFYLSKMVAKSFKKALEEEYKKQKSQYVKTNSNSKKKSYNYDTYLKEIAKRFDVSIDTLKGATNLEKPRTHLTAENILILERDFGIHRDRIMGDFINPVSMNQISGLRNLYSIYKESEFEEITYQLSRSLNKLSEKIKEDKIKNIKLIAELEDFIEQFSYCNEDSSL